MNTVSKFGILSVVAALMIATTVVVAASDADARDIRVNRNNLNVDSQVGQQNSGDTSVGGGDTDNDGDDNDNSRNAAGGNNVGGDLSQNAEDSFNDEED